MTPYWDDGQITVYCGDCRNVLPSLECGSIALIPTDPPYNVSVRGGRAETTNGRLRRKDGTYREIIREFGEWDFDWEPAPVLAELRRLLRPGGSLVAFTSEFLLADYLASGLDHRALLYWRKSNPAPNFRRLYSRGMEMAVWQTNGGPWTFNGTGATVNVFAGPILSGHSCVNNDEPRVHPTQKPLWLMRRLIELHSNPGDVLLDPFMGSGTTLRAAKDLGRRAIGIELEEKYAEIAVRRLAQGVLL